MFLFSSYFFTNFSLLVLIKFIVKKSNSIKREVQISMFSIPDIRAGNLACCTRDLLCNNIEIIRVGLFTKPLYLNNAKQFDKRWNFKHCLGPMEGKYIAIQKRGGSSHYPIQEYLFDLVINCC